MQLCKLSLVKLRLERRVLKNFLYKSTMVPR